MECHWGLLWTNDTSTVVYCKELDVIGVLSGFPDASFISTFTLYHSPLSPSSFHPSIYPFSPYRGHFNPFLPNIPFYSFIFYLSICSSFLASTFIITILVQ